MRVIAGSARGTRLAAPRGMHTRPTADRVREALFSIIQSRFDLEGARVVDICAGTGSLGIEALSRGAVSCCFIEKDRDALSALKKNISITHCAEQSSLLEMDSVKALRMLADRGEQFDIVFFDPPYAAGLYLKVTEAISNLALLAPGGLLIAESSSKSPLPDNIGRLIKDDRRIYGDTALEFYIWEEE